MVAGGVAVQLTGVRRAFEAEHEDGALEGIVLAPADKGAIYLGKVLASAVWLLLLEVSAGLMATLLFDVPVAENPMIALGGLVLLVVPVAVGAIRATSPGFASAGVEAVSWLSLLVAFDAAFLACVRVPDGAPPQGGEAGGPCTVGSSGGRGRDRRDFWRAPVPDSWAFVIAGYTMVSAAVTGYVTRLQVRARRARQRVERLRARNR